MRLVEDRIVIERLTIADEGTARVVRGRQRLRRSARPLRDPRAPGLFAVDQSNTGLAASEVATVAAKHFNVRSSPTEPVPAPGGRSKLVERVRVASRLTAQGVYRLRRYPGGRRRRSARSVGVGSVHAGGDRLASGSGKG